MSKADEQTQSCEKINSGSFDINVYRSSGDCSGEKGGEVQRTDQRVNGDIVTNRNAQHEIYNNIDVVYALVNSSLCSGGTVCIKSTKLV